MKACHLHNVPKDGRTKKIAPLEIRKVNQLEGSISSKGLPVQRVFQFEGSIN